MSESQRASTCHESLSRVPYVAKYTRVTKDVAVTNYAYESAAQGEHVSYMYGSHEICISYELHMSQVRVRVARVSRRCCKYICAYVTKYAISHEVCT